MKARKLGRNPARHDPRTLKLRAVLASGVAELPASPPARDWSAALAKPLPMFANDQYGCCTFASAAHTIRSWTANAGAVATLTDVDVLAGYAELTGFRPDDPQTDGGAAMLDVLNYWRNVGIGGHKLGAFAKIDHANFAEMQLALDLFGAVYVGVNLPISAQRDGDWIGAELTKGPDAPGSWGGHAMTALRYDRTGMWFATWAHMQRADRQWCADYIEEAYALFSIDWVSGERQAPNGLDVDALRGHLARV
jgi:hypothetical protein